MYPNIREIYEEYVQKKYANEPSSDIELLSKDHILVHYEDHTYNINREEKGYLELLPLSIQGMVDLTFQDIDEALVFYYNGRHR